MLWICFRGNDFANIKKFLPKHFVETLWYESFFEKRILQPWKIFVQKILFKMFGSNLFSKKLFWSHKKFGNKKNLLKIFGNYQFSGKWFCNHKNVSPTKCYWKFLVWICFRGNDFATIKKFDKKIMLLWTCFKEMNLQAKYLFDQTFFDESLRANLLSRKWFFNHKIGLTKTFC